MSRSKDKRPNSGPRISPALLLAAGKASLWVASLVAIGFGLHSLDAFAHDLHRAAPPALEFVDLPDWLHRPEHAPVVEELRQSAGLFKDDDVADRDLCARVAANLGGSPWLKSVNRVTKCPGLVRVHADIRQPLTMVAFDQRAYLVDLDGVRLPREMAAADVDPQEWIVLQGVRGPVPKVGESWNGNEIRPGLQLIRLLNERSAAGCLSCRAELKAVDASNFDLRKAPLDGQLRIITRTGTCIEWGMPPGEEAGIERTAKGKLDLLDSIGIKTPAKLRQPIDIRPFREYYDRLP